MTVRSCCACVSLPVPDKGKANAAVIALVAEALGVPKSSIALVGGATSRSKTLLVVGAPTLLAARAAALVAA